MAPDAVRLDRCYRRCPMIKIDIPGFAKFQIQHLVLDVNGTLAKDGQLIEGVRELLNELRSELDIHLITADTNSTQDNIDRELGLAAVRIPVQNQAQAKLDYIERLGADTSIAVGNGVNDADMLARAAMGIAIIGPEGASVKTLLKADIAVTDIRAALELLQRPGRIIATLRR
jgi:P-type E1-E2 ATPase